MTELYDPGKPTEDDKYWTERDEQNFQEIFEDVLDIEEYAEQVRSEKI